MHREVKLVKKIPCSQLRVVLWIQAAAPRDYLLGISSGLEQPFSEEKGYFLQVGFL